LEERCSNLILSDDQIERVSATLLREIENGLRQKTNGEADIKCYPTYVRNLPNGEGELK